ncbi:TetR/AcrR family transcriptional regulator [Pseudomonas sp. TTU2014-080ASC]|uniref:TetR/AcrR family transcriptional regulator n=1 Tax=Pseudomonas sp. TTU2014-080ASC TaxID=1729724 RepID=UPI0007185EF0|nr:TetR/AcrR family transcriptional regulator [Pseudomonas sp. TTU2014-080ASC]KRW58471.1 TetR family transcriptional regulator [Pseudomonas sp. TTU2014-080ASC]
MSTSRTITESALALFYRQGFHASGVEQLSQEAGVTKKTLYRHFPSKEHLVDASIQLRDEQFMARLVAATEAVAIEDRPAAYIDFIADWVREPDFHGCLFINAAAEYSAEQDAPHVLAKEHKERVISYLLKICERAQLNSPQEVAQQLFLLGEGLIVASQVRGAADVTIQAARQMAEWLIAKSH